MMLVFRKNSSFCDFLISNVCSRNHTFPKRFQNRILFCSFPNMKCAVISLHKTRSSWHMAMLSLSFIFDKLKLQALHFICWQYDKKLYHNTVRVILYHCNNKSPYSYAIYLIDWLIADNSVHKCYIVISLSYHFFFFFFFGADRHGYLWKWNAWIFIKNSLFVFHRKKEK